MTTQEHLTSFITHELLSGRDVEIAPNDNLLLSGLVDSIGVMSLLMFIETELGVKVPPEDVTIDNFMSISAMETYLEQRTEETNHV